MEGGRKQIVEEKEAGPRNQAGGDSRWGRWRQSPGQLARWGPGVSPVSPCSPFSLSSFLSSGSFHVPLLLLLHPFFLFLLFPVKGFHLPAQRHALTACHRLLTGCQEQPIVSVKKTSKVRPVCTASPRQASFPRCTQPPLAPSPPQPAPFPRS